MKLILSQKSIKILILRKRGIYEKSISGFVHGNRSRKPISTLDKSISDDIIILYKNKYISPMTHPWKIEYFKNS